MRKFSAATILATLVLLLTPGAGKADPYKWCAAYGDDAGGSSNCGFVTLEQCRATLSGMGGSCEPNPFYTGPAEPPPRRARKRRNGSAH